MSFILSVRHTFQRILSFISLGTTDTIADLLQSLYTKYELNRLIHKSQDYKSWLKAARELDVSNGATEWCEENQSPHYDFKLISDRLMGLQKLAAKGDIDNIAYALRAGLHRNLGGIANPALYERSLTGTKRLIEQYIDLVVNLLLYLACNDFGDSLPLMKKLLFFRETRHSFGRTALLLSGGASWAFNHVGVAKTLLHAGVLPRVISGSSGGALVAAYLCTRTDEELRTVLEPHMIRLGPFEELSIGSLRRKLHRWFHRGVVLDIKVLERFAKANIGEMTFLEAYRQTHRVLNVTVTQASTAGGDPGWLLNYLTAPNVLIWSAVLASSAIPGVFEPVELLARDNSGEVRAFHIHDATWVDGSLGHDLPMERLAELFNINQFIVSQVNPWVVPFLPKSDLKVADMPWDITGIFARVWYLFGAEVRHYTELAATIGALPRKWARALRLVFQRFTGDITIVPASVTLHQYLHLLSNPTPDFLQDAILQGERATWPKLTRILSRCAVEQTLEQCVHRLQLQAARMSSSSNMPATQVIPATTQQNGTSSEEAPNYGDSLRKSSFRSHNTAMSWEMQTPLGADARISSSSIQPSKVWHPSTHNASHTSSILAPPCYDVTQTTGVAGHDTPDNRRTDQAPSRPTNVYVTPAHASYVSNIVRNGASHISLTALSFDGHDDASSSPEEVTPAAHTLPPVPHRPNCHTRSISAILPTHHTGHRYCSSLPSNNIACNRTHTSDSFTHAANATGDSISDASGSPPTMDAPLQNTQSARHVWRNSPYFTPKPPKISKRYTSPIIHRQNWDLDRHDGSIVEECEGIVNGSDNSRMFQNGVDNVKNTHPIGHVKTSSSNKPYTLSASATVTNCETSHRSGFATTQRLFQSPNLPQVHEYCDETPLEDLSRGGVSFSMPSKDAVESQAVETAEDTSTRS